MKSILKYSILLLVLFFLGAAFFGSEDQVTQPGEVVQNEESAEVDTISQQPSVALGELPPLRFTKRNQAGGQAGVWSGGIVAGDPAIYKIGDTYYMYHTSFTYGEDESEKAPIAVARSTDGRNWSTLTGEKYPGTDLYIDTVAIEDKPNTWEHVLETVFVHKIGSQYFMYYSGHPLYDQNERVIGYYQLGLATSPDGINWTRYSKDPIIKAEDAHDKDSAFSPSVVTHNGTHYMVYTAWCLSDCRGDIDGFGLSGATSVDGINWKKNGKHILRGRDVPWGNSEPFEAELEKGPDGKFYLFFTMDVSQEESKLGVARSDNPFGPWEVYPEPILEADQPWEKSGGLIAPAVLIEDGKIKIWYMAGDVVLFADGYGVGYAEAPFPFDWK